MDAVDRVLLAVEQIPPGQVASYGLIGAITGVGPRQVGRIMGAYGGFVPWWRVTNARGELPPSVLKETLPHWQEEGIALAEHGRGCAFRAHVTDAVGLKRAYERHESF